jgi:hypothetical protein
VDLSNYQADDWGVCEVISVNNENSYGFVKEDASKLMALKQSVRKELLATDTFVGIKYTKLLVNGIVAVLKL